MLSDLVVYPCLREAGAGGSNPLSPTSNNNSLAEKLLTPQGVVSELCPCNVDPPDKIKAPASLAGEARADHSIAADWLADDTAACLEAQFPILAKHWWRGAGIVA